MKHKIQQMNQLLKTGMLQKEDVMQFFEKHSDIKFLGDKDDQQIVHFYCEGLIDFTQYNEYLNKIRTFIKNDFKKTTKDDFVPPIHTIDHMEDVIKKVFSGYLIFFINLDSYFYAVEFSNIPARKPEESQTEISIKGPKDAFTEELSTNVALIRKRMKTEDLCNETYEIGTLSKTKVSLLYIHNKIDPNTLQEVQQRLRTIETESVLSSGQLEQWISDRTFSFFPLLDYITRPDFAIYSLLRGRFVIIVNGSPSVLIGPIGLISLIKSPEDAHFPIYFVIFQLIIRFIGLTIAIYTPGFYLAITSVNLDQLPFSLLATIVTSRQGLPFSLLLEMLIILLLFEIVREAGIRMPTAAGQTISIVGGLIIGDATIRAGLASPTLLVVIATAAVANYTIVNQSLTGTVTVLRVYCILMSIFLGVYGFILSFLSINIYISQLESFRQSYLEPIASLNFKKYFMDHLDHYKGFKFPFFLKRRR